MAEVDDMELPERVRSTLAKDETVERRFRLKGGTVYTTDRRFFEDSGRRVTEYAYTGVASVSRTTGRFRRLLALGIAVAIAGGVAGYYVLTQSLFAQGVGLAAAGASLAVGLVLSGVGLMARSERLEVSLTDVPSRVVYKGSADRLQGLMQSINQKRLAMPLMADENVEEDEVPGFAGTLALLADLRDKGGISPEGFERIKQEARRSWVPGGFGAAVNIDVGRRASEPCGAAIVSSDSLEKQAGAPRLVKCDILTEIARDASQGVFDGAGSLAEAAAKAGASTDEIAEALGVMQFTREIGSLYRSSAALRELSLAVAGSTG